METSLITVKKDLIDSLFCKYCYHVDILEGFVLCSKNDCSCNEPIPIKHLMDVYSNLYFHMDNVNLANFETLIMFGLFKTNFEIKEEISDIWGKHIQLFKYDNNENEIIYSSTIEIIKNHLLKSKNNEELLIKYANWLFVIDKHLGNLREYLEESRTSDLCKPIKSVRGLIVFKRKLGLNDYLLNDQKLIPPVDPNYITLRNNIENFYLAKEHYPYYKVEHLNLTGTVDRLNRDNIGDLKIGFFPGVFKYEDYDWQIDPDVMTDGVYFNFSSVKNETGYYNHVMNILNKMLEESPDIIIFPELFTPKQLQDEIIKVVKKVVREKNKLGKISNPFLILPGSFHIKDNKGKIYNMSNITNSSGKNLATISKMNKFKIPKKDIYKGAFEKFIENDGYEKCAFDKREIKLFETPIGRLAIFICVDLLNFNIEEVLCDRHVDIVFVMTMTERPGSGKFLRRMQELGERNQSTIIICNNLGTSHVSLEDEKNGAYRIVAYFPGIRYPFCSNKEYDVLSIKEMIETSSSL